MIRSALAMAAVTLGVAAPVASAHPHSHSFGRTYPVASALCSRVSAGNPPKRLSADVTPITAACTTLSDSYGQTLTTYETAVTPIAGQVGATLATLRAARHTARQTPSSMTYRAAVEQARLTLEGLRSQERSAQRTYIIAIRAARHAFWTTIHALPGAGSLPADTGTPTAPTAPTVPSGV